MKTNNYPIKIWRPWYDIATCYLGIFVGWKLCQLSFFWYPVSFVLIVNRLLSLSLICHEGLHRNLFKTKWLNDFVGRYFCAIPTNISFAKYRRLHIFHHKAVGEKKWDPDLHLYQDYPYKLSEFIVTGFKRLLSGRTMMDFLEYYTDFFEVLNRLAFWRKKSSPLSSSSDFKSFYLIQILAIFLIIKFSLYEDFLLFYFLPFVLLVQPYVMLMGGLQHGPLPKESNRNLLSRSIRGPRWLMAILLPLNINYHGEHHYNAKVPHYWLKKFSFDLKQSGVIFWEQSYWNSLRALFKLS